MATNENKYLSVLLRNGTDQLERKEAKLQPDSVQLQGFELKEWMQFARSFAEKVNYFSIEDETVATTNWEKFFTNEGDIQELIDQINEEPDGNLTPHLTLFICFLQLMKLPSNRLNKLTKRHLDFYYKDILQVSKLPATEDKAYILFQLAKNVSSYLIEESTELDSGKDALGKKRVYVVDEEMVASKTSVAQIKNIYNEHNIVQDAILSNEERFCIKVAPIANSSDGIGGELSEEAPTWYPFGYYTHSKEIGDVSDSKQEELKGKAVLPDAKLGFAIASSVLRLSEGIRTISVLFHFKQPITTTITSTILSDAMDIYLTGEKKWIGPYKLVQTADTYIATDTMQLTLVLQPENDKVEDYVPEFHGEQYDATSPIIRFVLKTDTKERYSVYSTFAEKQEITSVDITVNVQGMKKLVLDSDTAVLNEKKPYYPFTTQPVKGSSFSIYNQEVFDKRWTDIKVNIQWKNTPESFASLYTAYESSLAKNVSASSYHLMFNKYEFTELPQKYSKYGILLPYFDFKPDNGNYKAIVKNDDYFKANSQIYLKEKWVSEEALITLFNKVTNVTDDVAFETNFQVSRIGNQIGDTSAIRLVLEQSFLHELYPRLYAVAISDTTGKSLIPNEPYTPFAESTTLEYTAVDSLNLAVIEDAKIDHFEARTARLFHEHPFGQSEEHVYLKKFYKSSTKECFVFPTYCKGGEMYIGLENAKNLDLISLYIKVAEGTENPLAKPFVGNQKIQWEILCNNVWQSLDSSLMIANETDNLLVSGRIKFTIPAEATLTNTLLPTGLFWIRAKMFKRYDAVCQLHGIHAQAVEVQFDNRENDLSHLEKGLPKETIAKLVERVSQVKSVSQPYASFGGVPEESDSLYYRRVSERLRHKNRAITLWDYEHLTLQQFPEVYKVKCLNHTCEEDYTTPGSVTIVVIPDTVNKTVFDIYQPRVSRGLLNKISAYLSELNSMQIDLHVINPNYEEVRIEVGAKFHPGLDENYYRKQLQVDIIKYLSPWAFESTKEVSFGVEFNRSSLVYYIEQLNYLDYIDGLAIYKNGDLQTSTCSPSNPKSILVSAKEHKILPVTDHCVTKEIENPETCRL